MEKVINFGAIKANHAERKTIRAEKRAERKAKREASKGDRKPVGKTVATVCSYIGVATAAATAAIAIMKATEMTSTPVDPEIPSTEIPVENDISVPEVETPVA